MFSILVRYIHLHQNYVIGWYLQKDLSGVARALKEFPILIFSHTKNAVSMVYQLLSKIAKYRACVSMYRASIKLETKNHLNKSFTSTTSQLCCLVATIALGLVRQWMMNQLASCCLFIVCIIFTGTGYSKYQNAVLWVPFVPKVSTVQHL